jgi:protein O-mannosyl-transferase
MNVWENKFVVRDFFLRSWHPYLWLALIASLPYLQILTFSEYTYYDDHFLIVESYSHIDEWSDVGHAFLEDVSHQGQGGNLYRPVLTISLILSAKISGLLPFGYHGIDILLHCISCCLLFSTLQILGFKKVPSFFGALFFCVHPALAQAVAWIAGRNDSLLAIFILLSFITYHKFFATSSVKWYFVHLFCFACAMFTKESAILLPVLALLYSLRLRKEKILSFSILLFVVGWGIVLINWHILRSNSMIAPLGDKVQAAALVLSNLPIALYYLGNIFWPFNIAFAPIARDIRFIAGIISIGLLVLAILLSERRDWNRILFGAAWFFAFLIPTFYYHEGVLTSTKFYEHRIYLPCIGMVFVLLSLSYTKRLGYFKRYLPPLLFFVFIFLGWLSYTRSFNFKNALTLTEYDSRTSPNDLKRYAEITRMSVPKKLDLELSAIRGGSPQRESKRSAVSTEELWKMIDDLKNELQSNNNDPELHHALAVAYFARGFFLTSEENFIAASRDTPQDASIPYNLGILYYSAHMGIKAGNAWQEALRLDSTMSQAHLNLSFLYYESGQYQSAWDHCQKAIRLGIPVPPDFVNEIRRKIS